MEVKVLPVDFTFWFCVFYISSYKCKFQARSGAKVIVEERSSFSLILLDESTKIKVEFKREKRDEFCNPCSTCFLSQEGWITILTSLVKVCVKGAEFTANRRTFISELWAKSSLKQLDAVLGRKWQFCFIQIIGQVVPLLTKLCGFIEKSLFLILGRVCAAKKLKYHLGVVAEIYSERSMRFLVIPEVEINSECGTILGISLYLRQSYPIYIWVYTLGSYLLFTELSSYVFCGQHS